MTISKTIAGLISPTLVAIAGLAIERVHNRWTNGWPMLVTILGWLFVLGSAPFSRSRHIDVIDHALRSPVYLASSMSLTAVCRVRIARLRHVSGLRERCRDF